MRQLDLQGPLKSIPVQQCGDPQAGRSWCSRQVMPGMHDTELSKPPLAAGVHLKGDQQDAQLRLCMEGHLLHRACLIVLLQGPWSVKPRLHGQLADPEGPYRRQCNEALRPSSVQLSPDWGCDAHEFIQRRAASKS